MKERLGQTLEFTLELQQCGEPWMAPCSLVQLERLIYFMSASSRVSAISADNLGIWASALCVVHCIVTPVLLSVSSAFARFIPGEETTHRMLAVGVAALGAIALIKGFRTHGRRRILGL